jgi:ribosome-associated protein
MAKPSKKTPSSKTSPAKAPARSAGRGAPGAAPTGGAKRGKPAAAGKPASGKPTPRKAATRATPASAVKKAGTTKKPGSAQAPAQATKSAATAKSPAPAKASGKAARAVRPAAQREAAKVISVRARPGARSRPAGPGAKGNKAAAAAAAPALPYRLPVSSPAFAIEAARLLRGLNCTDIVVLDVRQQSHLADYLVLASGTSDRQMSTVAGAVAALARERGEPVKSSASDTRTTWSVVDCIDTIVHVFEPSTRAYYDLETIHEGATRIDWEDGAPTIRGGQASTAGEGREAEDPRRATDEAKARARSRTRTERE